VEIHSLDEEIRELCAKAITAEDGELKVVLSELKSALREHSEFLRKMAAKTLNRRPGAQSSSAKAAS
jgi:hypothetical protein